MTASVRCTHTTASHGSSAERSFVHLSFCCLLLLVILVFVPVTSARAEQVGEPTLSEAQAAIVVDAEGNVLYSKNPDTEISMASITKIMTAVVALESGASLDATYDLQDVSLPGEAVVIGYQAGMSSTLRDLLRVMLVKSANDAACEVAIAVAGSEDAFIQLMNDKAAELGLTHTHFVNPHGFDADNHYSSVSDLVTLARYAMTTYPFIAETVRLTEVTVPVGGVATTFRTSDKMLETYPGMIGIKTGTGFDFTSFLGASHRDTTTLYTCVLGCTTSSGKFVDTAALLDWAWSTYDSYTLSDSTQPIRVEPFAYHFGLSCVTYSDATTTGLVWSAGGITTYQRIMQLRGTLTEPGETVGVSQWVQDGRVVGTCTYSARPQLVWNSSGFGVLDQAAALGPLAGLAA